MPQHKDIRILPYSQEQIFNMVRDVESYPDFLPWCQGVRVYDKKDDVFLADLIIGFRLFKERFTSRVNFTSPNEIHIDYIKGPLKYLHNDWIFSKDVLGTKVEFTVDFEFKNPIFQKLVGKLFEDAVLKMVNAFEGRAKKLYES